MATAASSLDGDLDRAAAWIRQHDFLRVAVQVPDELLPRAARALALLTAALPGRKVFLLGDSAYGSSSVDEVGAEHYGADCMVHVGASDQEHAGSLPVLFISLHSAASSGTGVRAAAAAIKEESGANASIAIVCDIALQHAMEGLAKELAAELAGVDSVFVAEPQAEAGAAAAEAARRSAAACWRDWRFGLVPVGHAWWSGSGPLATAAAARPEPLRVCGRRLRGAGGGPPPRYLPAGCGVLYVGAASTPLERRLLLRHGSERPIWRLDADGSGATRLSSDAWLLRRHRFVELVRSAGTIGLLICATGTSHGRALADRLEFLLRRAGRRVYRFVIGRVTPEKLGNFPDVECYVSLASPEDFPFESRDFQVPIASPYEVEVALGAREWTGSYITDLEELLMDPLPAQPPTEDALVVQTLGAGARMCNFAQQETRASTAYAPAPAPGAAPAMASAGLHGVAGRYASEPLGR